MCSEVVVLSSPDDECRALAGHTLFTDVGLEPQMWQSVMYL